MKLISGFLSMIWRVWFYAIILLSILVLLPLLYFTSLSAKGYKYFFTLARFWAKLVLLLSGFWLKVESTVKLDKDQVYIICPNHTSMLDIMVIYSIIPANFVFIGKKELAKLPLFGYFYKKTNILVDRSSLSSRKQVYKDSAAAIDNGLGICIFPEGGIPDDESVLLDSFKAGAFRLSVQKNIPILPVTMPDNKRHMPYDWFRGYPGLLRVSILDLLIPKENSTEEQERLESQCHSVLLKSLTEQIS